MKKRTAPKARKENLVFQEIDGEVLIYDLDTTKAFCLNKTSALIWQACDGSKDVSEIRNLLGKQLNSPVNEDLIWLALDQLKRENLIENSGELENKFEGIPRREAIRKIGMASLIALPVIAAIATPTAAQTASACAVATGRPNGCACTSGTQCSSTCCRSNTGLCGTAGQPQCI